MSSEETFADLFRDDYLQVVSRVERQALCCLDNMTPYCRSVLKRGLCARQEHGTGMGAGIDYSMEYMGIVGGMMMGLMAEMNDWIPAGHTFGGDGLRDFISDHQTRLEEGEANMDALRGEMAWMRTSLEQVEAMNWILIKDNQAFFASINMLLGAQQAIYEWVTALEGTRDNPIEVPDSLRPIPIPPPAEEGQLVEIKEVEGEDERVQAWVEDMAWAVEFRSDPNSD